MRKEKVKVLLFIIETAEKVLGHWLHYRYHLSGTEGVRVGCLCCPSFTPQFRLKEKKREMRVG